jgi:hypothetical protein
VGRRARRRGLGVARDRGRIGTCPRPSTC